MMEINSPMETEYIQEEQSIDSRLDGVEYFINRVSKQFLSQWRQSSTMLHAIQQLSGIQSGEKYHTINQLVKARSENETEPNDPNRDVSAQIQDFVSSKFHLEMKSIDAIIRCLTSEDKTIVNQAFKSKWFFHYANPHLNLDLFASSITPYASQYTRFRIIKALSRCLVATPKKAEEFFTYFADSYNANIALPLLTACGEDFIYDEVMRRNLILAPHTLLPIYKRCPNVVVRYLNLGHYENKKNEEARKIHSINLYDYKEFIPHLIRHHVEFFLELVESYEWTRGHQSLKIGSTLTLIFFKKAINYFIANPSQLIELWSIEVISKRLTTKQYEEMYLNLFPKTVEEFRRNLVKMISYLKGYPAEKRYYLICKLFKLKYKKDFVESLECIDLHEFNAIYDLFSVELYEKLFIKLFPEKHNFRTDNMLRSLSKYPKEKRLHLLTQTYQLKYGENLLDSVERVETGELFELLPLEIKWSLAKKIVEPYEEKSIQYYNHLYYLPLSECFPIYKEAIQKCSGASERFYYMEKMLMSCALYDNAEGLLQVIKYYNLRHANERMDTFIQFLDCITSNFDLKSFDEEIWIAILELFQKLNVKGDLSNVPLYNIKPFFIAAVNYLYDVKAKHILNHVIRQSILNMFHTLVIDYNINRSNNQIWMFSECLLAQKNCFDALLQCFLAKYSPEQYTWKRIDSKIKIHLVISIIEAMNIYNDKAKEEKLLESHQKYDIKEYPRLFIMTKEIFDSRDTLSSLPVLKNLLKDHSSELYDEFVGDSTYKVNITSGSAWLQLKKNYSQVLVHWREYLNECRKNLNYNSKCGGAAARRFLLSIKWYNTLPIYFVEQCLKELNEPGSLKVLALLLDSEVFSSLAVAFAPKESAVEYQDSKDYFKLVKTIPPAVNFANPPVPFDVIIMYCQSNYTQLAIQAFERNTLLVPKEKIIAFATNLTDKPVSVKKHGIRLLFKTASAEELRLFVMNLLLKDKHASIREFVCSVTQEHFLNSPSAENWRLVQICISALTVQDEACLIFFSNLTGMTDKFVPEYVNEFVKKIDELAQDAAFPEAIGRKCICNFLSNFTLTMVKCLPEQIILQLLEKYYFDSDSIQISSAAQSFAKVVFSEHYLRKT